MKKKLEPCHEIDLLPANNWIFVVRPLQMFVCTTLLQEQIGLDYI